MSGAAALNWESHWAPYDEATYQQALAWVGPDDVALEIGAGDLRLARRLAGQARQVYAIEMTAALLDQAAHDPMENLQIICSDARTYPFPMGVTVGVLLMRHCRHFHLYVQKLKVAGCAYLITHARWRMGVERLDLRQPRHSFALVPYGWYACLCGGVGFIPGPVDALTWADLDLIHEVTGCPQCEVGAGLKPAPTPDNTADRSEKGTHGRHCNRFPQRPPGHRRSRTD